MIIMIISIVKIIAILIKVKFKFLLLKNGRIYLFQNLNIDQSYITVI